MTQLVFVETAGNTHVIDARPGQSVMRAATSAGVPGIIGECGGCATCLTCHCFIDPSRLSDVPPPGPAEAELLDMLLLRRSNSRLTCQIMVTPALEGIRFDIPDWQG
jgi:2Fe-2S ferredoxin